MIDIKDITANTDINGVTIVVGSRVRTFDFPLFYDGNISGMELVGDRACFCEGIVEAIGEDHIEGCYRYRIMVERQMFGGIDRDISVPEGQRPLIYPPLNGTPSWSSGLTFGVVVVK